MASSSCSLNITSDNPVFSSNTDQAQATHDLKTLLRSNGSSENGGEGEGGRWSLIDTGKGIERSFKFKTFKKTWEFMNLVASECAMQKHHPEWSNVYNTTFIRWTTHSPSGLSHKDITMARFCDEKAAECGELAPLLPQQQQQGGAEKDGKDGSETVRGLVSKVVTEGGDCCMPKKKEQTTTTTTDT